MARPKRGSSAWRSLVRKGGTGGGTRQIAFVQQVFIQSGSLDTGNFSLPRAPLAGNLLIAATNSRGSPCGCTTGGLVAANQPVVYNPSKGDSRVGLWSVVSNGSNVFRFGNGSSNSLSVLITEWSGVDILQTSSMLEQQGPAQTLVLPGVVPNPAKSQALLFDIWGFATDAFGSFTLTGGWNKLAEGMTAGGFGPSSVIAYRIVAPPAGAVSASADCGQTQGWGGVMASFTAA